MNSPILRRASPRSTKIALSTHSRQSVPHRFTLSFVSQIPHHVSVLHDFKFSALLTTQSGRFFNVFAGSDANGDGNPLSDRPGTLGRNTLKGPSFATVDMRIAREVSFTERLKAEFSADFFNLFNRDNITDLNTVYGGIDLNLPPNPVSVFGCDPHQYPRRSLDGVTHEASWLSPDASIEQCVDGSTPRPCYANGYTGP